MVGDAGLHPQPIWIHPVGICSISNKDSLISTQNKTCDSLQHPRVACVEVLRLETTC